MKGTHDTDKEVSDAEDSDTLDDRTERALTEYLTVTTCDVGDENVVEVHSQSGKSYVVDAVEGTCTCPDAEYNLDETETCKHAKRARFALGLDAVPVVATLEVDETLGCGTDADLRFATTDGGVVEAGDDAEVLTDDEENADTDECDECAELDGMPCFECYMNERGHTVGGDA